MVVLTTVNNLCPGELILLSEEPDTLALETVPDGDLAGDPLRETPGTMLAEAFPLVVESSLFCYCPRRADWF